MVNIEIVEAIRDLIEVQELLNRRLDIQGKTLAKLKETVKITNENINTNTNTNTLAIAVLHRRIMALETGTQEGKK